MDEADVLSERERRVLAAWAHDDPPDGFADAVVAAWVHEQSSGGMTTAPAARGRRPVVGIVAGLLAAAAVLLLVRGLAGEAHSAPVHEQAQCDPSPEILDASLDAEPTGAPLDVLAADALAVLTHHCMPCHDGADERASVEALRVYDVRRERWWDSMSDEQLEEARLRIQELGSASDAERRTMAAFVDGKLRQRAAGGSPS